jgi:hypothetical protein
MRTGMTSSDDTTLFPRPTTCCDGWAWAVANLEGYYLDLFSCGRRNTQEVEWLAETMKHPLWAVEDYKLHPNGQCEEKLTQASRPSRTRPSLRRRSSYRGVYRSYARDLEGLVPVHLEMTSDESAGNTQVVLTLSSGVCSNGTL